MACLIGLYLSGWGIWSAPAADSHGQVGHCRSLCYVCTQVYCGYRGRWFAGARCRCFKGSASHQLSLSRWEMISSYNHNFLPATGSDKHSSGRVRRIALVGPGGCCLIFFYYIVLLRVCLFVGVLFICMFNADWVRFPSVGDILIIVVYVVIAWCRIWPLQLRWRIDSRRSNLWSSLLGERALIVSSLINQI